MVAARTLHLGWGIQSVRALLRLGAEVVCTTTADQASAARATGAEVVVVQDPGSVADTLAGLSRRGMQLTDFELICSGLEYYIVQAAVLAELGHTRGYSWQQGLAMRDKAVQKQLVRDAGIPTAQCQVIDRLSDVDRTAVALPSVLKPLDGAGTKYTVRLTSAADLDAAVAEFSSVVEGPWLLESFTPGAEFFVDAVVRDGEMRLCSVSRYLHNMIDIRHGEMVGYVSVRQAEHAEFYTRIKTFTAGVLRALGCQDAVIHLEIFDDDGRFAFGECASRVGGARVDKLVELAWGIDLHDEWARVVLGVASAVPAQPDQALIHYGGMNVRCATGTVVAMPSAADVLARDGVVDVDLRIKPGQPAPDHHTASNARAGQLIVSGATIDELTARMRAVDDWFYASAQTR
ncbi:MAG: ATP-grasp domain-containing protein [Actinomycetota bacterium]|nr:ATP-grasp domain-containing protein [Actinomycetota bacterium]